MPIPQHVTAPPNPDRRYITTLAAYLRDTAADRGCKLPMDDCEFIAEKVIGWGTEVVEGVAALADPHNPGQLALANAHADAALHNVAAQRRIGLNTLPQHSVRQLSNGRFLAVATSCGMPLVPPHAGQRAEMAKAVTTGE